MKGFASFVGQRVETKYDRIVQSIALSIAQHTTANAYNIECVPVLICMYMPHQESQLKRNAQLKRNGWLQSIRDVTVLGLG